MILDIGGARSIRATRRALASDGMLIVIGGKGNVVGPLARIAAVVILKPFSGAQKLMPFLAHTTRADLLELAGMIEAGTLRVVVDRTFELADAGAAIRHVEDGQRARQGGRGRLLSHARTRSSGSRVFPT